MREGGLKNKAREREREMWAVSQLAVTGADEPQVVQLGASTSPESWSSRDGHASGPGEITLFKQMKCEHCLPYANKPHLISSLPVCIFEMSPPPEGGEDTKNVRATGVFSDLGLLGR